MKRVVEIQGDFGATLRASGVRNVELELSMETPGFFNLQILPQLVKRMKLADIMTILGSIDIIMGEVDRLNDN
jgi:NADH:ubiquinone oxidoreductase subunit D